MRFRFLLAFALCSSVLCGVSCFAQTASSTVSITRWPNDWAAAISLTFDDGINTDLAKPGPSFKKHHLNGTFFVTTGMGPWEKRKAEWKQLAEERNELANHTVHHPCLLPQITPHSQDYTPEMMEVTGDGKALQAQIKDQSKSSVLLVDVPPQTVNLRIARRP